MVISILLNVPELDLPALPKQAAEFLDPLAMQREQVVIEEDVADADVGPQEPSAPCWRRTAGRRSDGVRPGPGHRPS